MNFARCAHLSLSWYKQDRPQKTAYMETLWLCLDIGLKCVLLFRFLVDVGCDLKSEVLMPPMLRCASQKPVL